MAKRCVSYDTIEEFNVIQQQPIGSRVLAIDWYLNE